jgi:hypothetical protein
MNISRSEPVRFHVAFHGSLLNLSQEVFELGEHLFDGAEIRAAKRKEYECVMSWAALGASASSQSPGGRWTRGKVPSLRRQL